MPANTPIYNFPYPLGTDPVSQGDNDIRALAEDVETVVSVIDGKVGSGLSPASSASNGSLLVADGLGGSAWQAPTVGLVYVGSFSATNTSRALVCDNVFTDEFDNYRILLQMASTSNLNELFFQYINTSGGVIATDSYFSTMYGQNYGTATTTFSTGTSLSQVKVGWIGLLTTNAELTASMDIYNARSTTRSTQANGLHTGISAGVGFLGGAFFSSLRTTAEAVRGLRFDNINGTNLTGTVKIYGYKN
jgi:hypothetical protein